MAHPQIPAKVREIWACVGNDPSQGGAEAIMSCLAPIPPSARMAAAAQGMPLPPNMMAYVLSLAYDRETAKLAVQATKQSGRPFRVLHFVLDADVTAEF